MGPDAYRYLSQLGLPHPTVVGRSEVCELDPDTIVYFRGHSASLSGKRLRVADAVRLNPEEFKLLGEQRSIEISPNSIAGGAVLITKQLIYAESVSGHVSGLLRHGYCAGRFAFEPSSGKLINCKELNQRHEISQTLGGYRRTTTSRRARHFAAEGVKMAVESVATARVLIEDAPILLEFMFLDSNRVCFVDYKKVSRPAWLARWHDLFGGKRVTLEDQSSPKTAVTLGENAFHKVKMNIPHNFSFRISGHALLAHLFTYTTDTPRRLIFDPTNE